VLEATTLSVRASVGVACAPDNGSDVDTLMQRADAAMYVAKRSKLGHTVYTAASETSTTRRIGGASGLGRAIERGQLEPFFQPQVSLGSGMVVAVEALVRWDHPEQGVIGPGDFIPLAEQTGLMKPLTATVTEQALRECARWRADGLELGVSINLSAQSLVDRSFPGEIAELLERTGVPATALRFEITESSVLGDDGAVGTLDELCALGMDISIDDFGTGYSSLAYLKRLPVREVKIDRAFVMTMATDERDAKIVRSTVALAQSLGLRAVAEGVEDEATWDMLESYGCDLAQGYLIAPALDADALMRWLQAPTAGSRTLVAPRSSVGRVEPLSDARTRL
jgi:EAL domain-containing protein (putative c-di-GMP-specific phosphodiesterase class I)